MKNSKFSEVQIIKILSEQKSMCRYKKHCADWRDAIYI